MRQKESACSWGGGGGEGGGAYWTPAGDSIEKRASNVLSGTVAGFINKTNVCLIMFDGNSMGSLRSGDRDGNENGKKAIDLAPLHMIPVDWADRDDPG